jgi:hypothetical protein
LAAVACPSVTCSSPSHPSLPLSLLAPETVRSLADVYAKHTHPAVLNQLAATLSAWVRADFSRSREAEAVFTDLLSAVADRAGALLHAKSSGGGAGGRASGTLPRGMDLDVSLRSSLARLHYLARYWDVAATVRSLQPK